MGVGDEKAQVTHYLMDQGISEWLTKITFLRGTEITIGQVLNLSFVS